MLQYKHNEGATSSKKLYINPSFSATAVTLLPPLPRQWAFLAECWNKTDILPPSPFCVWLSWLSRSLQNCPEYRYRLFRADLQYEITYQVRFIGQRRYYKYYEEQMLRYTLYTFLSKRRSAKYRLPTEIYSPLRRIWTLKADGLTTHRERSLSVHCLHSSVLFSSFFGTEVFSFLTSRIILYRYGKRKIRCPLNSSGRRFR